MSKRALIAGVAGQDGLYLAEHLADLGYDVHATVRDASPDNSRVLLRALAVGPHPPVTLHAADLSDAHSLLRIVDEVRPAEVYNLAARSGVRRSFDQPISTGDVAGLGAARLRGAIRSTDPEIRFFHGI